jgi:aryl-alcohol dehydrogenase-like predicted oxidoreductase
MTPLVRELLAWAHDLGINLIDTAPAYGRKNSASARCAASASTG